MRSLVLIIALTLGALVLAATSAAGDKAASACARGYSPCLPVVTDLDCAQIPDSNKPVRVTGSDPYGLDRDRDGVGCESSSEGGGAASSWGLVLRKGTKEAAAASIGDTLTVVGWLPARAKGAAYDLCGGAGGARACALRDRASGARSRRSGAGRSNASTSSVGPCRFRFG